MAAFDQILQEFFRHISSMYDKAERESVPMKDALIGSFFFECFQEFQSTRVVGNRGLFYEFMAYAFPRSASSHGQIAQDLWVSWMTQGMRGGTFVEVGAGDGVHMSNTLMLERDFGWSGLLVEPNPANAKSLKANRSASHLAAAITPTDRSSVRFAIATDAYLSRVREGSAPDMHDRIGTRTVAETIEVSGVNFASALEAHQIVAPDYLSLDVEGLELAILESIDFGRWKIPLITVEHNWSDNSDSIFQLMKSVGYACWLPEYVRQDYFFHHPNWLLERLEPSRHS